MGEEALGMENRFAITDRYLGKVIHISPGEMLSLQYHVRKDETILIVKGVMALELSTTSRGRCGRTGSRRACPNGSFQGASTA
jgi:mannose-6-phosphate isomerase-like protein (cupin superfamily)